MGENQLEQAALDYSSNSGDLQLVKGVLIAGLVGPACAYCFRLSVESVSLLGHLSGPLHTSLCCQLAAFLGLVGLGFRVQ